MIRTSQLRSGTCRTPVDRQHRSQVSKSWIDPAAAASVAMLGSLLVVIAFLLPVVPATANTYWIVENSSDNVYAVDIPTRTATLVGSAGIGIEFGGMGFDTAGNLFAWESSTASLYSIDPSNGTFSEAGPMQSVFGADTFDINPASNEGILWTVDYDLHTVDLETGAATFRTDVSPQLDGLNSAFDRDGNLYSVHRDSDLLYGIDVDTGDATPIGPLGLDFSATNLGYNPADGMLYAIEIANSTYPLYQIDPATGAAAVVGNVTGLPPTGTQQVTMGTFLVHAPEPTALLLTLLAAGGGAAYGPRRVRRKMVSQRRGRRR